MQIDPNILKLGYAFLVGSFGSAAYITALYFKFIGDTNENRRIVIEPFLRKNSDSVSIWKCIWYCLIGGFVALVFQYDVPNFVAVQSLILGATWPAIVSQFLSGRMANPSQKEIEELLGKPRQGNVNYLENMKNRIKEVNEIRKSKKIQK